MGWIKFLPGKKTIQSPGKTNSLREAILFDHTTDIDNNMGGIDTINWRREKVWISQLKSKEVFWSEIIHNTYYKCNHIWWNRRNANLVRLKVHWSWRRDKYQIILENMSRISRHHSDHWCSMNKWQMW